MIGTQLTTVARRRADAVAVTFAGRRLTYAELEARACRVAHALGSAGVGKGDRVAALLHNCNEFVELFFGAAKLGAIFVPLNFRLTSAELERIFAGCAPSLLVAGEEFAPVRDALIASGAGPARVITVREPESDAAPDDAALEYESWIAGHPGEPAATVNLDDPQLIIHSSGTTGVPKGAVWTHATTWFSSLAKIVDFQLEAEDTVVVFGPLFHAGPLMDFAVPLLLRGGGRLVLGRSRGFDPEVLLETLEREQATIVTVYPTLWRRVLAAKGIDRFDAGALRILSTGGEPMSLPVLDAVYRRFPEVGFINTYGSTEGGPVTTFLAPEHRVARKGSVGKPAFSVDVRIVDDAGVELPAGEVGELTVRSPFVCKGYWQRDDFTRDALRDGWWHTGDLAWRDDDGFIYISGRSRDMVISGAENIYPVEVEQAIVTLPQISEAGVIGAPDEEWGERVVAFVACEPGCTLDAEQVRTHCRAHIAGYKVPREVLFVDSLPRNGTNKVDRGELRRHYERHAASRCGTP